MDLYIVVGIFFAVFVVEFICILCLMNIVKECISLSVQQNAFVNKTYHQNMALCEEKQLLVKQVLMLEKRIKELEKNKGEE